MSPDAEEQVVELPDEALARDRDDIELFREYRATGHRRLRNEIVERHMGLAGHIARRFGTAASAEDVRQVAMLGLVKAVDRFDPEHGAAFGSFAGLTIEGEIKRHFRAHTWSVRVPRSAKELHLLVRDERERLTQQLGRSPTVAQIAQRLGLDRDDVLRGISAGEAYQVGSIDTLGAGDDGDDDASLDRQALLAVVDDEFAQTERRQLIDQAMEILEPRERRIVELRFYGQRSQSDIADRLGISQMHVSRLLRRSFEEMREHLTGATPASRS
ncbi:MAG: SigB/SigF/SigG family RNA polymerase sigma factor [Actinomycetota bacterium]